ncbi:SDR family NAD(P)-dependent oxidoreductase [Paraburkholderia sp. GAS42]|jgi:short-subunit dehydrogenase|uniref:SDR family NAD(P)-dependent oxidoreductase n=1 Tax=Paraburkholderia sp. GAS42 TaxID=3035135 RepID=UPI003D21251C
MSLAKAVVVGIGAEDGLGAAISRCYAANNRHVLVAGRTFEKLEKVAATIRRNGGRATAYAIDTTQEEEVIRLFDAAMTNDEDGAPADLVTYNAGKNLKIDFRHMDPRLGPSGQAVQWPLPSCQRRSSAVRRQRRFCTPSTCCCRSGADTH